MPSRPSLRDQPKKLKDQDSVQDMEAPTAECVRERSYKQLKPHHHSIRRFLQLSPSSRAGRIPDFLH